MPLQNQTISDGVNFLSIEDDKFKTNRLSVSFVLPLDAKTASANAILPHILRHSCKKYPDFTALNRRLCDLYGARLYANGSKIGDNQVISLSIAAIDDRFALEKESVTLECAGLLCSLLFEPLLENNTFVQSDFDAEKRQLVEEIENEITDKRTYARNRLREQMCKGEPFAVGVLGSRETASALTNGQATQSFERMLKESRIQIIMSGTGDSQPVTDAFKNGLKSIKRTPKTTQNKIVSTVGELRSFGDTLDVNQAKLVMGFRTGIAEPSDDVFAARLMTAVLGGTPHSRLFLNVRERLSLCYYCAAGYDKNKGILTVDSGLNMENVKPAKEEVMNQLAILKSGDFSDDEVISAKLSVKNSYGTLGDNQGALSAYYLGQIMDKEILTPSESAEKIEAVSREEIIKSAQKVLLDSVYVLAPQVQ